MLETTLHLVPVDSTGDHKEAKDHSLRIANWLHIEITKLQEEL